jgi:hypothetical protein
MIEIKKLKDGSELVTVTFTVTKDGVSAAPTSSSGKSKIIASTGGNQQIASQNAPGLKVGLNAFAPNK